jgi:hypothetical protein
MQNSVEDEDDFEDDLNPHPAPRNPYLVTRNP